MKNRYSINWILKKMTQVLIIAVFLLSTLLSGASGSTSIDFGLTLSDSILSAAEMDAYVFSANSNDYIIIRASKTSGNLYPGIRLMSPEGTKLQETHGSTTGEISYKLTSSGTYTILIYDGWDGTRTGNYNIHLQRPNSPGSASPITFGDTLLSSILLAAEMDAYTFTGSSNDNIVIRATKTSDTLYPGIRLYGPDGSKLQETHGSTTGEISYKLLSGGTFTILIYDGWDGTRTGNYNIYLGIYGISSTPASTSTPTSPTTTTPTPIQTPTITSTPISTVTPAATPTAVTQKITPSVTYVTPKTTTAKPTSSPMTGSISISSSPSGASIYIDGVYQGKTPSTLSQIIPGSHMLNVTLPDYKDWQQTINIAAGSTSFLSKQLESIKTLSPSISFISEKTDVEVGEEILLKLSAVNIITKPVLKLQAIIIPVSGMSVTSSEFVQSGAGQFTAAYEIEPGKGRDIEIRIKVNQPGDFNVGGRVVYYFGIETEKWEDYSLNLPIKVRKERGQNAPAGSADVPVKAPGFGGGIAIIGVLFMAIYIRKRF